MKALVELAHSVMARPNRCGRDAKPWTLLCQERRQVSEVGQSQDSLRPVSTHSDRSLAVTTSTLVRWGGNKYTFRSHPTLTRKPYIVSIRQ
jgi:hypothetical protein